MSYNHQVNDLYRELLGREADAESLQSSTELAAQAGDINVVRASILNSSEYARRQKAVTAHRNSVFASLPSFSQPERIEKLSSGRHSRPLMLMVETTNICNNDCIICPYSSQTRKRQTMTLDLFSKLLSDYEELGGGALSFTPIVGDVFVDKHLIRRIEMVRECNFIRGFSVTTNGVLASRFDDAELDYIVSSFDRIKISVYGLDREEYRLMTRKDQYDVAMENITRLVRRSKGNVVLGLRMLKERPPSEIEGWIEGIRHEAGSQHPLVVKSEAKQYSNWNFFDTSKPLPFSATWRPAVTNDKQCLIPLLAVQVTSAGNVSFCACANFDTVDRLMLGNINTQSLAEMYNSDRCRELWDWTKYGVPEFCRSCSFHLPIEVADHVPWLFDNPTEFVGG
jgi:sulfatase maturation enzyme AslB (radical SAM superfamily)